MRKEKPLIEVYGDEINFFKDYVVSQSVFYKWEKPNEPFRLRYKDFPVLIWDKLSLDEELWKRFEMSAENKKILQELRKNAQHLTNLTSEPKILRAIIHTDEDRISEQHLHFPFSSIRAFDLLSLPVPTQLMNAGRVLAQELLLELYKKFQQVLEEEKYLDKKLEKLRNAASTTGTYVENGAIGVAEDEDDIAVATLGDRIRLKDMYDELRHYVQNVKEYDIPRFLDEFEIYPGIKIDVKKFVETLEKDFHFNEQGLWPGQV